MVTQAEALKSFASGLGALTNTNPIDDRSAKRPIEGKFEQLKGEIEEGNNQALCELYEAYLWLNQRYPLVGLRMPGIMEEKKRYCGEKFSEMVRIEERGSIKYYEVTKEYEAAWRGMARDARLAEMARFREGFRPSFANPDPNERSVAMYLYWFAIASGTHSEGELVEGTQALREAVEKYTGGDDRDLRMFSHLVSAAYSVIAVKMKPAQVIRELDEAWGLTAGTNPQVREIGYAMYGTMLAAGRRALEPERVRREAARLMNRLRGEEDFNILMTAVSIPVGELSTLLTEAEAGGFLTIVQRTRRLIPEGEEGKNEIEAHLHAFEAQMENLSDRDMKRLELAPGSTPLLSATEEELQRAHKVIQILATNQPVEIHLIDSNPEHGRGLLMNFVPALTGNTTDEMRLGAMGCFKLLPEIPAGSSERCETVGIAYADRGKKAVAIRLQRGYTFPGGEEAVARVFDRVDEEIRKIEEVGRGVRGGGEPVLRQMAEETWFPWGRGLDELLGAGRDTSGPAGKAGSGSEGPWTGKLSDAVDITKSGGDGTATATLYRPTEVFQEAWDRMDRDQRLAEIVRFRENFTASDQKERIAAIALYTLATNVEEFPDGEIVEGMRALREAARGYSGTDVDEFHNFAAAVVFAYQRIAPRLKPAHLLRELDELWGLTEALNPPFVRDLGYEGCGELIAAGINDFEDNTVRRIVANVVGRFRTEDNYRALVNGVLRIIGTLGSRATGSEAIELASAVKKAREAIPADHPDKAQVRGVKGILHLFEARLERQFRPATEVLRLSAGSAGSATASELWRAHQVVLGMSEYQPVRLEDSPYYGLGYYFAPILTASTSETSETEQMRFGIMDCVELQDGSEDGDKSCAKIGIEYWDIDRRGVQIILERGFAFPMGGDAGAKLFARVDKGLGQMKDISDTLDKHLPPFMSHIERTFEPPSEE